MHWKCRPCVSMLQTAFLYVVRCHLRGGVGPASGPRFILTGAVPLMEYAASLHAARAEPRQRHVVPVRRKWARDHLDNVNQSHTSSTTPFSTGEMVGRDFAPTSDASLLMLWVRGFCHDPHEQRFQIFFDA